MYESSVPSCIFFSVLTIIFHFITNVGVSAQGQVVALNVRSIFPKDVDDRDIPVHPCDSMLLADGRRVCEHDYCTQLNRALPGDIRVIGQYYYHDYH